MKKFILFLIIAGFYSAQAMERTSLKEDRISTIISMTLMVADIIEKAHEIAFQKRLRPEVLTESVLFETEEESAEELNDFESPCSSSYSPDLGGIFLGRRSIESLDDDDDIREKTVSPGEAEISRISRYVGSPKSGPHAHVKSIVAFGEGYHSKSFSLGTGKKAFMIKPLSPKPASPQPIPGLKGRCMWCHKKVSAQDLNSHMRKFHKDQEKRLTKRK